MKKITLFLFALLLVGCGTTSHLPLMKEYGKLPDGYGVVAVATGRKDGKHFLDNLPFISYYAVHIDEEGQAVTDRFLPAEPPSPQYPFGNLGDGKYGFLHIFELPEGEYTLVGGRGRGSAIFIAGGGFYAVYNDGQSPTSITYPFSVEAGQINYLGEILTIDDSLTKKGILLSDQSTRDRATAIKLNKALAELPFTYVPPKSLTNQSSSPAEKRGQDAQNTRASY